MSKQEAQTEAIRLARQDLEGVNLRERLSLLGIPVEEDSPTVIFRCFGKDMVLSLPDLELTDSASGKPGKDADLILLLHYLMCDVPVNETPDELIKYRDLPSGQFYLAPFEGRTVKPLLGRMKNNLQMLGEHLDRFDWSEVPIGDFGARIHAFGNVYITLVYHVGDDEFPADADVLFDSSIKRALNTEDVAVMASRICIGLL